MTSTRVPPLQRKTLQNRNLTGFMHDHVDERFSKIIITSAPVAMFEIFQRVLKDIIQGYTLMKRFFTISGGKKS